ncbi:hypothetical protein J0656_19590 [Muricauda ruestringensis]|uniref:NERD domain-containing protein n=1 Tax=Flagellimonas aurea TaxID=2915619 RepID=A0ABS3GA14_9FLAO|nr:hypothetical protein [Allomuricauda aurea]MBO0356230.1 hypothetical protein [Allomuricauda aurea]
MDPIEKGNIGEEFVNEIAFNSFLEYWCYPSPKDEYGDKKEICDLLILFGENLIIISVKNYEFKEFYSRYFRRTIDKAVKQIYGAERKLFNSNRDIYIKHPKREIERFPKEKIKNVHRLIINLGEGVKFYPFNQETKDEKFITLWDKEAYQTIIQELDTIPDFLEYLTKREALFEDKSVTILPGEEDDFPPETMKQFWEYEQNHSTPKERQRIIVSGTEHDILAYYLKNQRSFPEYFQSDEYDGMFVQIDGNWRDYNQREQVKDKRELDKDSYFLDELVKREILTSHDEKAVELATALMSFNRFTRRIISTNFLEFFDAYKDSGKDSFARRYGDFNGVGVVYVFYAQELPQEMVNTLISIAMESFCFYSNYKSKSMILIATTTEFRQFKMGLMKDIVPFSNEKEKQIKKDIKTLGWFTHHQEINFTEKEYPDKEVKKK